MSWTVSFTGTADDIGKAFDTTREQSAGNGMVVGEQREIDEVRDFAVQIASKHGRISVNATGHWSGETLGAIQINIAKAVDAPPKGRAVRH